MLRKKRNLLEAIRASVGGTLLLIWGFIGGKTYQQVQPPMEAMASATSQDPHSDPFSVAMDLLEALAALATLVSTYYVLRPKDPDLSEEDPTWSYMQDLRTAATLEQIIDPITLNTASERIHAAHRRYDWAIRTFSPNSPKFRDESIRAEQEICSLLQLILMRNGGQLPSSRLRKIAYQFDCFLVPNSF